jgi:hypothetical protein
METKENLSKGITLVALVITIIILLILAGVAITTLTQTDLFKNAKQAKNAMENAANTENTIISSYENKINEIIGGATRENNNQQANSQNTISGEEHFIGEYYFNNKPIYSKTIYIESLPNNTTKYYSLNINDVDEIWFDLSNSYCVWESGVGSSLPFVSNSNIIYSIQIGIEKEKNKIKIRTAADRSNVHGYITVRYTKTTDTGNGNTIEATPAQDK